jgi:hypothetical protein
MECFRINFSDEFSEILKAFLNGLACQAGEKGYAGKQETTPS